MRETLLIDEGPFETRAAVLKGDQLLEVQIEREGNLSRVGDFFNGRVAKILPDMDIAFIDLGPEGDGFLQFGDISTNAKTINTAVHEGEKILVQVIKDAKGEKGLQLGCRFALHGANLILRPIGNGVVLSKSINASEERSRLKALLEGHTHEYGLTVRTAAQYATDETLLKELEALAQEWTDIQVAWKAVTKPSALGQRKTPLASVLKNFLTANMDVIVSNVAALTAAKNYIAQYMPGIPQQIKLWDQQASLFEEWGVEAELDTALQKSVPLTSGGNITIERTEAAIVIDVNSAGHTQAAASRSAALSTNLEAAREICRQIRLCNLSGIIIIDFIQMNGKGEVKELTQSLQDALNRDPRPTRLIGMTELGLMQMTRKRGRPSLHEVLCYPCKTCDGGGYDKNEITVLSEIFRALQSETRFSRQARLTIEAGEKLASLLRRHQTLLEKELARPIMISENAQLSDFGYTIG